MSCQACGAHSEQVVIAVAWVHIVVVTMLEVGEREEGVVALDLPTESLKPHLAWELTLE